jgi:alkylation response protein AidB-like acyl-CoA dehydrogenase
MIDGTWGGTMCLTEAHAGTDLGMIRTRAVPDADGTYEITGQKIFISAGEHDLTENICHLVLAKLPDAPAGHARHLDVPRAEVRARTRTARRRAQPRLVLVDRAQDGDQGERDLRHQLRRVDGWLVGDVHKGMRAMFTMMNGARLGVGMQGLGHRGGRATRTRSPTPRTACRGARSPARSTPPATPTRSSSTPTCAHAADDEGVRRGRARARLLGGQAHRRRGAHPTPSKRQEAGDLVALMTPIIKAFLTDTGFEIANLGLQCYGGHGYIREWGMEQFVRDARIAQIYEGTNGVQAMDLIGRKVPEGNGRLMRRFLALVQHDLKAPPPTRAPRSSRSRSARPCARCRRP